MKLINNLFNQILLERKLFMGIAIVMVVLYHLSCFCGNKGWTMFFYPGFLGVDIFLLLSGYGLCNSFQKNDSCFFYKHRVARLLPLFLFMMISATIVDSVVSGRYEFSILSFLCNVSSLSYYGLGGWYIEWYLCFLILLCIFFPLIYRALEKYVDIIKDGYLLDALVVVAVLLMTLPLEWYYKCAIGRLPIFCVGVLYFLHKIKIKHIVRAFALGCLLAVGLFITHKLETFGVLYMFAPFIMLLIVYFLRNLGDKLRGVNSILEYIGRYTLEIYVANIIIMKFRSIIEVELCVGALYLIMQTLLSIAVIGIHRKLTKNK